jgi:hypothetical protein
MTIDRWIDALKYSVKYSGFDSIKDKLDLVELIELLDELKKRRESDKCVCDKLQTELFDYNKGFLISDYEAGYDDGIKKAIDILKEVRDSDGRE